MTIYGEIVSILPDWGSELRKLRKNANLTQGQLIEQLSLLTNNLSEEEKQILEEIDVYNEAITYFNGILDTPTLSRLEKGSRSITLRRRCVALIWGLRKLGVLQTIEEANSFLEVGGHGNLTTTEADALFKQDRTAFDEKANGSPAVGPIPQGSEEPSVKTKTNRSLPLVIGLLLLAALLGVLLFQTFFTNKLPQQTDISADNGTEDDDLSQTPPITREKALTIENAKIVEDFSTQTIDPALWNNINAPSATSVDGRLHFDTPINNGEEWTSESLEYNGEVGPLARLTFEVSVETPDTNTTAGSLGIATGCQNDLGWLNIYAGEDPLHLFAEYAIQDQTINGERIEIMPIESGKSYTLDMLWNDNGVQLSAQGETDANLPLIPCNYTEYFNISTSVDVGEKVKGSIDWIRVWN